MEYTLVERWSLGQALGALLERHPLVGVYGPPGSGKTGFLFSLLRGQALAAYGKPALLSLQPIAADSPLRRLAPLSFEQIPAGLGLARLAGALGLAPPGPPPELPAAALWTWIADPQDARPIGLILLDGYEQLGPIIDWFSAAYLRAIVVGGGCRLVCAQRTRIDWRLSEVADRAGALEMEPFAPAEIARFVEQVIAAPSPVLAQLLAIITAGFPLALALWSDQLAGRAVGRPAAPPGDWASWRAEQHAAQRYSSVLLVAGFALLRGFDRAALRALLFGGAESARIRARLCGALGLPPLANGHRDAEYVRALRALRQQGWVISGDGDEAVAPALYERVEADLQAAPGLLADIDACLAAHYRERVKADPFRAQDDVLRWLEAMAGREQVCIAEHAQLEALFAQLTQCLAEVLRKNPMADVSLIGEFYTSPLLIGRLRARGLFPAVDALMQGLIERLSDVAATTRMSGLLLSDGQEIHGDDGDPRGRLMRLPQQALMRVLGRIEVAPRSWERLLGPDFAPEDQYSRHWIEERAPGLYASLRASGLIAGRTITGLSPMVRDMFRGEDTLFGRLMRLKQ